MYYGSMHLPANKNYQALLTTTIKDQMIILGPDITLAKIRKVPGITVSDEGTVLSVPTNPKKVIEEIMNQFVTLSPFLTQRLIATLYS